jgi:hypothetical protein
MALNVGRWVKYARARIDGAVNQGNRDLDRLEAEREVELADKPWLRSDSTAPSLDETRARIEWEAARQREEADRRRAGAAGEPEPPPRSGLSTAADPSTTAADAEAAQARLELDARQREATARLEEIRRELGVEPAAPADDAPDDTPPEPPAAGNDTGEADDAGKGPGATDGPDATDDPPGR